MRAVGQHHIALDFDGPTLEAALGRAVEVFADALADVHPSLATDGHAVELSGITPAALLLSVLEECLRQGREGQVAVALDGEIADDGVLRGVVRTVPVTDPRVAAALPHVVSWHEVSLEPDGQGGGWRGRIVAR